MSKYIFGAPAELRLIDEFRCDRRATSTALTAASPAASHRIAIPITAAAVSVCSAAGLDPIDAGANRGLQGGRHIDVGRVTAQHVRPWAARDYAALGEITHHLLGEERIPGGAVDALGGQVGHRMRRPQPDR